MFFMRLRAFAQLVGFLAIGLLMIYGAISIFQQADIALGAPAPAPSVANPSAPVAQAGAPSTTVPPYLNYQGTLRDPEGKLMSGLQNMTFRLYDRVSASLNEAVWVEQHDGVPVRDGQFSVLLGNNTPLPANAFYGPDMFIGVTVAPFDEMVPRQRFASVPYAVYADHASSLTRPDGAADQAVYVDPAGRVGIGTTSPTAQVQISNTTGATNTVQLNAGSQQLALDTDGIDANTTFHINAATNADVALATGGGRVGIGTAAPDTPLHIKGDDPDVNLDINSASPNNLIEIRFSEDGVQQSTIRYSKSTNDLLVMNKGLPSMTFDDANVGVNNADPNATLDVNGELWVRGNLRVGALRKPPVQIIRMGPLSADSVNLIPGVSPEEYDCVASSWSVRMDVDEDDTGPYTVWTFIQGSNWMLRTRFWTDSAETSKVDVLCFLRGAISSFDGNRFDGGFN